MKNKIKLSASRIKTLQSCSWLYFCNYHLKLPQKNNSGAMRGTVAHLIFELLTKDRHQHYISEILENKTIKKSPAILKLVTKSSKQHGLNLDDIADAAKKEEIPMSNLDCIDEMVIVGLKFDFINYKKVIGAEIEFDFTNQSPSYRIGGFIDRIFEDNGALIIRDFKSSKKPFTPAELKDNVQAMMYSLAAKKKYKQYKDIVVKFLFLRHPDKPERVSPVFSDEELKGFEYYLEYVSNHLETFNEKTGMANFAANDYKKKWMCKTNSGWRCPYLDPFEYKVLLNDKDEIIKSSFANETFKKNEIKEGFKVKTLQYNGCPAWHPTATQDECFF